MQLSACAGHCRCMLTMRAQGRRAGPAVLQGLDGKTALEVAKTSEVKELLQKPEVATA